MIGTTTSTVYLFGFIPLFTRKLKTLGPTTKEITQRLTPELLQAVHDDEELVEKISKKIAIEFKGVIQEALNELANVKR